MTADELFDPILARLIAERDHAGKMRRETKSVQRTIWKAKQEAFQGAIDYVASAKIDFAAKPHGEHDE